MAITVTYGGQQPYQQGRANALARGQISAPATGNPNFDADAYVANLDQRALHNLISTGPNLATANDRLAAVQAAKRRLQTLNPFQRVGMNGMGTNTFQQGLPAGNVTMPGAPNPGVNNIAIPPGAAPRVDVTGPRANANVGPAPTMNGMAPNGGQNFPTGGVNAPNDQYGGTWGGGVGQMPGGGPIAGGSPRSGTMAPGQEFLGGSPTNPAAVSTMAPMGGFGAPSAGLAGAEQAYQAALAGGLGLLQQGAAQGRADLMQAGAGANNTLNRYYNPGYRANDYQAALSGALGNAAQQQAMDNFMGSPGQQYLLNESERAIKRNAAATGGLGGGNVQRALQENAIGLAAQDFDNAFNRLGTISDRGLAAGGQISGNTMTTGGRLADLTSNNARAGADLIFGTGAQLGAGRTRAGEAIAGNVQTTGSNLADIMYGTGRDMANVIGAGGSNLAEILRGAGRDTQVSNAQLAELLANLSTSQGSQFAGLPTLGSTQQTSGLLSDVIGGSDDLARILAMISDARLKTNIRRLGTVGGVNVYSWDWTDEGAALAGDEATVGVLAQEHPQASVVGPHGYLMVDYSRVW